MSGTLKKWEIERSKYLVNDKFLKLRLDQCITPQGGRVDKYYVFEYGDWVTGIAIDKNFDVAVIKQYRHGVREYVVELVGGGMEESDSSPEVAIRRELEEEVGYVGGELFSLGAVYPNPANHTNRVHSFLVVGGDYTDNVSHEVGETILIDKMPFKKFIEMISAPDPQVIYQSLHVAAVFFAINYIKRSRSKSLRRLKEYA